MDLESYLQRKRQRVDEHLERYLPREDEEPCVIHRAMRYSIFAGGKRLRPVLVLATGESLDCPEEKLLPAACAIEMIHTYSLIHDDLPSMDNDDLRRGRPTNHKVFGEAIAILSGDALLSQAFWILSRLPENGKLERQKLAVIQEVAAAIGTKEGMIAGQVMDLEFAGRPAAENVVNYIHRSKTGALIAASVRAGALLAGAKPGQLAALTRYGLKIGLAFQIVDDILDLVQSSEQLGKTAGKDQKARKPTYPALWGIEESRRRANKLVEEATVELKPLGLAGETLAGIARFILDRHS